MTTWNTVLCIFQSNRVIGMGNVPQYTETKRVARATGKCYTEKVISKEEFL